MIKEPPGADFSLVGAKAKNSNKIYLCYSKPVICFEIC